jgi:hypothetical protein
VHGEAESVTAFAAKLQARGVRSTVSRPGLRLQLADLAVLAHDQ